jgi:hypothetical protein
MPKPCSLVRGAFDQPVAMDSPFFRQVDKPDDLIRPAVDGTTNVLRSVFVHIYNLSTTFSCSLELVETVYTWFNSPIPHGSACYLCSSSPLVPFSACLKEPKVQRLVVTSSLAACLFGHDQEEDPSPLTEADWNNFSTAESDVCMHW